MTGVKIIRDPRTGAITGTDRDDGVKTTVKRDRQGIISGAETTGEPAAITDLRDQMLLLRVEQEEISAQVALQRQARQASARDTGPGLSMREVEGRLAEQRSRLNCLVTKIQAELELSTEARARMVDESIALYDRIDRERGELTDRIHEELRAAIAEIREEKVEEARRPPNEKPWSGRYDPQVLRQVCRYMKIDQPVRIVRVTPEWLRQRAPIPAHGCHSLAKDGTSVVRLDKTLPREAAERVIAHELMHASQWALWKREGRSSEEHDRAYRADPERFEREARSAPRRLREAGLTITQP